MIKIENTEVFGWETAIRGMRNPMNSWEMSDTEYCDDWGVFRVPNIGENDLKLMQNLAKAGNDHAKYLRMINVTCDITAPLYWWKEFDTYKVGTVSNGCSTMHKIHAKEFTLDDFSHEHLVDENISLLEDVIRRLNTCRRLFVEDKHKREWWQMIQLLPSSYNQKRTIQMNYQVLRAMDSREFHKLDEWREFVKWRNQLPYYKEIFQIEG